MKMSGQIVFTFLEGFALMNRQSEHAGIQNKSNPYTLPENFYYMLVQYRSRGSMFRDLVLTRQLDPGTPDLEQWIIENRDRLRKQFGADA